MENAPSKRRRTSLTTFTTVSGNRIDAPKTPQRASSHDGSRTPTRALFMSPTKASLARFNPHLLPPSVSAENKSLHTSSSITQRNGSEQRDLLNGGKVFVTRSSTPMIEEERPEANATELSVLEIADGSTPVPSAGAKKNGLYSPPRRRSRTPQVEHLGAKKVQPNLVQDPRAASHEAPGVEKSALNGLHVNLDVGYQNGNLESTNSNTNECENGLERANEQEPEFTYTASKRLSDGISQGAEPRGPLTPSQLALETPALREGSIFSSPTTRAQRKNGCDAGPYSSMSRASSPAMDILQPQPLASLGPRVLVTNRGRVRSTQLEDSAFANSPVSNHNISRYPSSLSQRIALFLPFSTPMISKQDASLSHSNPSAKKSMGPGGLSSTEINVTESILPPAESKGSTTQEQHITIASPQQLLIVKYHLVTDKKNQKNTNLMISSISPWAKSELGQWLQAEAVKLDRSIIEKTISRYWELSKTRAICWYRCEQNLQQQPANHKSTLNPPAEEQRECATPLPSNAGHMLSEHHPPNLSESCFQTLSSGFHAYLGQQSLSFTQPPDIFLSIIWRVIISPAGSITSSLSAHAAFPDSWTRALGGNALGKTGEAFDLLVREVGVFEAVRVMWGIVFGM